MDFLAYQRSFSENQLVWWLSAFLLLCAVILCGLQAIPLVNLAMIFLMVALCPLVIFGKLTKALCFGLWGSLVLLTYAIATYRPEGFSYPAIWESPGLHEGGAPFIIFVNLSKGIGGLLLLAWLSGTSSQYQKRSMMSPFYSLGVALLGVVTMTALALWVFSIALILKFTYEFILFFGVNLIFTVIPEEVFFRLLLQKQITTAFDSLFVGKAVALVAVGVLFAFVHAPCNHHSKPAHICRSF